MLSTANVVIICQQRYYNIIDYISCAVLLSLWLIYFIIKNLYLFKFLILIKAPVRQYYYYPHSTDQRGEVICSQSQTQQVAKLRCELSDAV